jgi:hypothetical protein
VIAVTVSVATPRGFTPERAYALDVVLREFLGLRHQLRQEERPDVEITLGDDRRLTLPDVLFSRRESQWLQPASLPSEPLGEWEGLPVLYGASPGTHDIPIDVFGSAFFLLTRYEEIVCPQRDHRDRFPARASIAARAGFLTRPLIDEYTECLWRALAERWPRLERRPRSFRIEPTHDVDWPVSMPSRRLRTLGRALEEGLLARDLPLSLRRLATLRRERRPERDPAFTFDAIMDASERVGLTSTFNFIAGRTAGAIDGAYSLDEPWIRGLLRRIHERGHVIGLHPSYETYRDGTQLQAEFETLQRACEQEGIRQGAWVGRQHFLRWANPDTWQHWEDAGLAVDSTLGWADTGGFRSGTCYEHPVFNLRTRCPLRLRERPLVMMEIAIAGGDDVRFERALARDFDAAARGVLELKQACRAVAGDFVLLWHNNRLISKRARELFALALEP